MAAERPAAEERRPDPDPTVLTTQQLLQEISWLKELMQEKFTSAATLTSERFSAVKEAVLKADGSTADQLKQTAGSIATVTGALQDKIDDVKDRLSVIESRLEKNDGRGQGSAAVWAMIAGGVAIVSLLVTISVSLVSMFAKS